MCITKGPGTGTGKIVADGRGDLEPGDLAWIGYAVGERGNITRNGVRAAGSATIACRIVEELSARTAFGPRDRRATGCLLKRLPGYLQRRCCLCDGGCRNRGSCQYCNFPKFHDRSPSIHLPSEAAGTACSMCAVRQAKPTGRHKQRACRRHAELRHPRNMRACGGEKRVPASFLRLEGGPPSRNRCLESAFSTTGGGG